MNYETRKLIVEQFHAGETMKRLARTYAVSLFEIEGIIRDAMKLKPQRIYRIRLMDQPPHYWLRIVAQNGKIVATTETYPSRRIALKSACALVNARLVLEEKR